MSCKGVCPQYKAKKPVGIGRYASGQKRCQICELFMRWDGLWCPCCGYRLRGHPRNVTYKEKLKETDFKAGAVVRVYKDWRHCKEYQFKAVLLELLKPLVESMGALWLIERVAEKGNKRIVEKRIINIANKSKVLV